MVKIDIAIWHFHDRIFWIHNRCFCHTHDNHNKNHRKHHQTSQNIHAVRKHTHKLSRCECRCDNHLCTHPADQQNTGIDGSHHNRRITCQNTFCFQQKFINIAACFLEFFLLVILSHISFYYTNTGNIFLYTGI